LATGKVNLHHVRQTVGNWEEIIRQALTR